MRLDKSVVQNLRAQRHSVCCSKDTLARLPILNSTKHLVSRLLLLSGGSQVACIILDYKYECKYLRAIIEIEYK